ncbi:shikimate kinase [Oceanobacillus caeni]|uniref:shikimate kinase n=1 Tax=Oceanobacillus caeni TaxID=405946 RepID=UPI000621D67A|nr:shikimate kinase [Oceanobacillus caeni]KKE79638.1 shikimate kinase [Bacilli bacterium VT-13-104]PZD89648.1 shikimate kinase [Bacilli bacterium]MCR1833409.1 shikimate kinase [Oceanobacillus caeni]PZD91170.1 shikimate kinase [Bacilli bacterium]PZD92717.1 shikimate kinase [Bacilli bacterium]
MGLNNVSLREQNIVLIGFMGAGKTTIGKAVARKLYRDFIDIDEEIEKEFNMPTPQIFQVFGEKTFREKEKEIIQDFCKNQRLKIISLGGGAFLQKEIKETCLANSIVFYLSLSWESWKERISMIIDNRPVLQGKNYEEMKELFEKRQPIYEEHHSKVTTDNQNVEEIADYIVSSLKTAWDIYEPNR